MQGRTQTIPIFTIARALRNTWSLESRVWDDINCNQPATVTSVGVATWKAMAQVWRRATKMGSMVGHW